MARRVVAAETELPVRLRVGDAEEVEVGTLTVGAAEETPSGLADFLRAVADVLERVTP
jgi:hypothetical protein